MFTADLTRLRQRLHITGVVQGVGFRPFVYGLAQAHGLAGFVGNDSAGVFIEVEGPAPALQAFQADLIARRPPLAYIETMAVQDLAPLGEDAFRIVESEARPAANTLVSPDIALCADCRRELFDPADRRFRYPFINCTNCGPRFTIIRDIPYDRPLTTMASFTMCPECAAEYHDPLNRRFHAQPNACPAWSTSPQVQPPSTRMVRAAGSTRRPLMFDRSMTRPSSQTPRPPALWPPPRIETSRSWPRAKSTLSITSATSAHRTIARGRLSIIPL